MKLLRQMESDDIDAVVALIEEHEEDDAMEAERDYRAIGGLDDQFVLEQKGEVIGVTGYQTPPGCDNTHWLSWTYIHKQYTNQGLGRNMLIELIDYLKQQEARKLFIKMSDYVSDEDGAIYAAALHLYQSLGFAVEITHKDFYAVGESEIILGMCLQPAVIDSVFDIEMEHVPVQFNSVYEIAETEDIYSFGWRDDGDQLFSAEDVRIGIDSVREQGGRGVFLNFPANYAGLDEPLLAAGFQQAGTLRDYYEEGIHEQHYVCWIKPATANNLTVPIERLKDNKT